MKCRMKKNGIHSIWKCVRILYLIENTWSSRWCQLINIKTVQPGRNRIRGKTSPTPIDQIAQIQTDLIIIILQYQITQIKTGLIPQILTVQFENYATLIIQTPIITSKCCESHLHTFVGNQTTNVHFLGGGVAKRGHLFPFLPFFFKRELPIVRVGDR